MVQLRHSYCKNNKNNNNKTKQNKTKKPNQTKTKQNKTKQNKTKQNKNKNKQNNRLIEISEQLRICWAPGGHGGPRWILKNYLVKCLWRIVRGQGRNLVLFDGTPWENEYNSLSYHGLFSCEQLLKVCPFWLPEIWPLVRLVWTYNN